MRYSNVMINLIAFPMAVMILACVGMVIICLLPVAGIVVLAEHLYPRPTYRGQDLDAA